jgi:hypothetical protein
MKSAGDIAQGGLHIAPDHGATVPGKGDQVGGIADEPALAGGEGWGHGLRRAEARGRRPQQEQEGEGGLQRHQHEGIFEQ